MCEHLSCPTQSPADLKRAYRLRPLLVAALPLFMLLALWLWPALVAGWQPQRVLAGSAVDTTSPLAVDATVAAGCSDLLENGGFEQGVSDWGPWVAGGFAHVTEERSHSGYYGVWMGGYKTPSDTLYQAVTLPAGVDSATLHYWWNMHSLDDVHTPYDYLHVELQTAGGQTLRTLATLDNTHERDAWREYSFDLTPYAGQSLRIHFRCSGNARFVTSYFLDDIRLETCVAVATPTPTSEPSQRLYLPLVWHRYVATT